MEVRHVFCAHCRLLLLRDIDVYWAGKTESVICADCARAASSAVGTRPARNPNVNRINLFEDR